MNTQTVRNVGG